MTRKYESFRYYRNMGATPLEAIEALRMDPKKQTESYIVNNILVEFNPWLAQWVVHLPKIERYFFDKKKAFAQARDQRLTNRQLRHAIPIF
jgi:hypothetical protein